LSRHRDNGPIALHTATQVVGNQFTEGRFEDGGLALSLIWMHRDYLTMATTRRQHWGITS